MLDEIIGRLPPVAETMGWCSRDKAAKLADIVLAMDRPVCVELGVFGGSSLLPIALACQHTSGRCFGVDPWCANAATRGMIAEEHIAWWSREDLDAAYWHCAGHVLRLGLEKQVSLLRETSDQAACRFGLESIDVLHIDGNHSCEQSLRDVTTWLPKVRRGGWIVFDDVDWAEGGNVTTELATAWLLQRCDFDERINGCAFLRRR